MRSRASRWLTGSAAAARTACPEMTREISPARRDGLSQAAPALPGKPTGRRCTRIPQRAASSPARRRSPGSRKVFYTPHGYGFLMQDRSAAALSAMFRAVRRFAARVGETIAVSPSEVSSPGPWPRAAPCTSATPTSAVHGAAYFTRPRRRRSGWVTYARDRAWLRLVRGLAGADGEVRAAWIGGGEDEAALRARTSNGELSARASITGWKTAAGPELMRGLDLFVHYSRWDAMPNAVLEGHGRRPARRRLRRARQPRRRRRRRHRLLVETRPRCSRAAGCLADPGLRERLGAAGPRARAREFSRDRMIAELSRLYMAN